MNDSINGGFLVHFFKIFFVLFCLSFSLYASETIKIFILHSYSQEYPWTKSQHDAFVKAISSNTDTEFEFYIEYLDTKRVNLDSKYENDILNYIHNKYNTANINLVYVTDDDALRFMHHNYANIFQNTQKIPVFFSGINDLNMNTLLPKDTFVGVYEVKEVKKNIELIKQFSPQTRDIYILGDSSPTYDAIEKVIQQEEKNYKNIRFHYISENFVSKIQNVLPNEPRSFVLLTTIGHLKDDNNNTLLVQDSIKRIKENPNLILLSMEDTYMKKGVIGGYVTKGSAQGSEVAKLVLEYLKSNSLDNIHSLQKSPNVYIFNSRELTNARVILSEYIARDAIILGKDANFLDKNESLVLNILTIVVIVLLLGLTTLYLFYKRLKNFQSKLSADKELENLKLKLNSKDDFINHLMSFDDTGYWRLDMKANELFLSPVLSHTL
mgnify:CR=1 FL=1